MARDCRGRESCFKFGKLGHRQKDCREVHAVDGEEKPAGQPKWCLTLETDENHGVRAEGNILELTADSGTEVHITPSRLVTKFMKWIQGPEMVMRGASGEQLKHYGRVELLLRVDQNILKLHMEVVDARRASLGVSGITDRG